MSLRHVICASLISLAALAGCQTSQTPVSEREARNIFWPPPPDEARIAYVQSMRQPSDIGIKRSGWGRFFSRLFGAGVRDQLVKPFGLALDENDNLCLTDTGSQAVIYYDRQNKKWQRWERIEKIRFISPVAVAKTNGVFLVADPALGQVIAFDSRGKLRWVVRDELTHPAGLALAAGRLFVADAHRHRVAMFDLDGRYLSAFGQRGSGPGEFNFPTHLAADAQGNIYVTDSMNSRVQVFNGKGDFKSQIGSAGDAPGYFSRPKGVAVDSLGHVYVVDANFDNFQILDQQGRVLLDVGSAGLEAGQFWLPNGIAISRRNEIFVADSYNRRVQIFKYVGPR